MPKERNVSRDVLYLRTGSSEHSWELSYRWPASLNKQITQNVEENKTKMKFLSNRFNRYLMHNYSPWAHFSTRLVFYFIWLINTTICWKISKLSLSSLVFLKRLPCLASWVAPVPVIEQTYVSSHKFPCVDMDLISVSPLQPMATTDI